MRCTPFLLALALVACDAKDTTTGSNTAAKTTAAATPSSDPKAGANEVAAAANLPKPNDATVDHTVALLDGTEKNLRDYRGKALLVVNTASECGHTPQYAGLQEVYGKYKDRGLEVLAFPSNDFGGQEPGSAEQIREFVDSKYSVEFEMFDKVVIKGDEKTPLYRTLTEETADGIRGEVEWNFTKFLIDPEGRVVQRFDSAVEPNDPALTSAIERVLPKA